MIKKFLIIAVALISTATVFTSCGDDDPVQIGFNGKFSAVEEPGNKPTSIGYTWLVAQIDSLNKVYGSLGTDLGEAAKTVIDANKALATLQSDFNRFINKYDCGADAFNVSYKFNVSNEELGASKEMLFQYEGSAPRVVADTTIVIAATESFKVTDSLKKTVDFKIKNIKDAKTVESLDGFKVVKANTKEFFNTEAFYDIKAASTKHITGKADHEFILTYTIGVEDKEMIDNFYLLVPIKVTKEDDTESIIDYVVNIEIN